MNVEGCTALIGGANRGLGRALAGMLVQRGARKVHAAARDPTAITDSRLTPVQLDVTPKDHSSAAAAACTDVDVLVNNARVVLGSPALADDAVAALCIEFAVNVIGLLSVTTAFVPIPSSNGGGVIANVLSVVSWYVYPFKATYCASKHAALALTDGLRIQLRSAGSNDGVIGNLAEMSQTVLRVVFRPHPGPRFTCNLFPFSTLTFFNWEISMQATRSLFARMRGTRIRFSREQAPYFNCSQQGSPCAV
jgi:NAD(P)-dependent dehydrogenase (short-subunit alcohol dehydrogenase family)